MKRTLVLLTSALAFFLFSFTAPKTHDYAKKIERKAAKYSTYYVFGYYADNTGVGDYNDIYVFCYLATQYPSGTEYASAICPASVVITVSNGPLAGDSFTFPGGQSSDTITNVPAVFPYPPVHYDISTDPLQVGGEDILSGIYPNGEL